MIEITLTEEEVAEGKEIAKARQRNKERVGITGTKVESGATDLEIHEQGALGEVAVAKFLGVGATVNTEIYETGDGDNPDIYLGDLGIEVKTRTRQGGDFAMYDAHTDLTQDIGVLVWQVSESKYELAGWITKAEWYFLSDVLWFGKNPRRGIEAKNMRDIETLYELTDYL